MWNSHRSLPFVKEMTETFKRNVAYALLTFRNARRLTQPLALRGHEKDVAYSAPRIYLFLFLLSLCTRISCTLCYDILIWFLPRCNFSQLHAVQTECLTNQVNSSPRVAFSAWEGLASAVLYPPWNRQDGQCSKSVYAYQSDANVPHWSVAVSGELGKISDPIRFRARGFLSGNRSGKLLFEFLWKSTKDKFL